MVYTDILLVTIQQRSRNVRLIESEPALPADDLDLPDSSLEESLFSLCYRDIDNGGNCACRSMVISLNASSNISRAAPRPDNAELPIR